MRDPNNLGNYDAGTILEIKVKRDIPESLRKETAMHEIIHALMNNTGISSVFSPEQIEMLVQSTGYGLTSFIVDNKEFFKECFLNEDCDNDYTPTEKSSGTNCPF